MTAITNHSSRSAVKKFKQAHWVAGDLGGSELANVAPRSTHALTA